MPSSLTEKLQALRAKEETEKSTDRLEEIKKMSLKELEAETIQFGKAKLGVPFPTAFADNKWTDWFVSQYEKSEKAAHQKFVVYVEKRLDHEAQLSPKMSRPAKIKTAKPVASEASWDQVKGETFSEDSAEEMSEKISASMKMCLMEDQMNALHEENKMISQRMGCMEAALSEVLLHIKALKTEP
eukprot:s197_g8.t1